MRLAFSYYVWQKHFQPANDASDECTFMRFAALQCTLLNIRALDEFFRNPKWPGDIRAKHYPRFTNPGPFLSLSESEQLHKLIVHLTYNRIYEFTTTWKTHTLLTRAYVHFKAFVDYIHDDYFSEQINIQASIHDMKNRYEGWLSEMNEIVETTRA